MPDIRHVYGTSLPSCRPEVKPCKTGIAKELDRLL